MPEYRHGALYVVEDRSGKHDIDRALRQIDRRLFVERQLTLAGEEVWCVVTEVAGDHPPLTILEWRDENDRPIPELSSGLIERVKRIERDPFVLAKKVKEANEKRKMRIDRDRDQAYEDMARDLVPRITGKVRPVLHRGQTLRMSRDKRRARGEKT